MAQPPNPAYVMAASAAAPHLDPETIVAAAQSARSAQEAIGQTTATAGYAQATNTVAMLKSMDVTQQRALWGASTPSQQAQWSSAGYTEPPSPKAMNGSAGGLIGSIFGGIAHAGSVVGHGLSTGASAVLSGVAAPLRAVQHLTRAGHVLSEMGDLAAGESPAQIAAKAKGAGFSFDINDFGQVFSASAWSRAWRETTNGEKTFDPAISRQIQTQVDPGTYKIAAALAGGTPEQELVNSYAPAQRQAIVDKIQNDSQLKQTVTQLQNSKMSPGRSLVGEQYLTQHPEAGKLLSGGIDAAFDVAADPTMHLGKAATALDAARWGIDSATAAKYTAGNASDYEAVINNWADKAGAQRWLKKVTDTINGPGGYGALQNVDPRLAKVSGQLADEGIDSPESLTKWLSSQAGMSAILGGKAARLSGTGAIMPHLSVSGLARLSAKNVFGNGVDFLADRGKNADQVLNALKAEPLHAGDLAGLSGPSGATMDGLHVLPDTAADVAPLDGDHMLAKKAGGYASSVVLGGPTKVARAFRQMTTLTADKPYLDLTDPESAINLKRMLQYALPAHAVNKIVDMYVRTPDLGEKFNIVKGATAQMLHLAGVYSDKNGPTIGDHLMDAVDKSFHGETYSPLGLDKYADDSRSAVLDGQESTKVHLPSFHEVHAAAKQSTFLKGLGIDVPGAAEKFMAAWRTGVLLRPGFPIRVSIDENLGYALRNGGTGMVAARLANRTAKRAAAALKATQDAADGVEPQLGKIARAVGLVTDHVPAPVVNAAHTTRDLASAVFGDAAWKAFHLIDPSMSRQDYHTAAGLFHQHVWDGLAPNISAVAHAGGGYDEAEHLQTIMVDGKPQVVRWKDSGTYSEATKADPLYHQKWGMALGTVARSKIGKSVLADIGKSSQTQVRNVVKILRDPEFAEQKAMFKRSFSMPDGRQLGVDATQEQIDRAWARTAVAHVNALVRSSDPQSGPVLQNVVDEMLHTGAEPKMDTLLAAEKQGPLPDHVYGPDLVPITSKSTDLVQKGFTHLSQMMDWLAREPNTLHAFATSLKEVRPWAEKFAGGPGEKADELAAHIAADRALAMVKPFIHSPEVRSQFEVLHRTAMPFLFAQDQFIKRWVKTFVTHPDAIAKAQLGMNGLRTSGVIHKDANGNEFFYYPGSQYVTTAIARAAQAIGIPASVPLSIPFTGQIKAIMPGLSNPLTPSVGPTVAIPMKAIASTFPEMQGINQAVLGAGASNSYWQQILPTTLTRLIQTVSASPDTPGEFSSTMVKAIQQLQANGDGLPADATTAQKQQFIDRVKNWTRILFFTKTALGFTAPASPSAQFDPKDLSGRLSTLMGELPYDQAIATFMKEDPGASPYTVFASKSVGGSQLPSTQAAGQFLTANASFIKDYPQASGWLIPRTTGNQPFDSAVYREQIQVGLRDVKTPATFLDDVLIAPASKTYYLAYDKEQAALLAAKHQPKVASQIRSQFDAEKAQFMAQNPTFADSITSSAKKVQREQTITELNTALLDPSLPQSSQTQHVKVMMQAFDSYQQQYTQLLGQSSTAATKEKTAIKDQFIAEGTAYAAANPEVSDMWTTLIRPEITDTTMGLADTTSAQTLTGATSGQ